MALSLGFLNVVLRAEAYQALDARERWITRQAFGWHRPWFRFDDHLWATTFLAPRDARAFCAWLEGRTALRRPRDFGVVDATWGPAEPLEWLEHDVRGTGLGIAVLKGEPWEPLDAMVDLLPGPCTRVRCGLDRDQLHDPPGPDGTPRRPADTPTWGGTHLWFFAKPGTPRTEDPKVEVPMVTQEFDGLQEYLESLVRA